MRLERSTKEMETGLVRLEISKKNIDMIQTIEMLILARIL